jgi:uncharacterized protein YjlB
MPSSNALIYEYNVTRTGEQPIRHRFRQMLLTSPQLFAYKLNTSSTSHSGNYLPSHITFTIPPCQHLLYHLLITSCQRNMPSIKSNTYVLPPTPRIPNSPYPLIHYPSLLIDLVQKPDFSITQIFDLFRSHGWQTQWIARYGPDIQAHYHSTTHEAMIVVSGQGATIRFGVADAQDWEMGKLEVGERGQGEQGGVEIRAGLGDVFIIPAGVSHKTFKPSPETKELAFHQPEDIAQGKANQNLDDESEARHREFFAKVPIEGEFMMMGAYPRGGVWDFAVGGEHEGKEGDVWNVEMPREDPVLGNSEEGLRELWKRA